MSTAQEVLRKRRSSWEVCAGAASEMRTILDELEKYSGIYEETTALRKQLDCIERACGGKAANLGADPAVDPLEADGDPKAVAQNLIAQMPLQKIFQDPALSDAFLSELLLALARESSYKNRRERQRQGIEEARAKGVRFGAPKRALPEHFEELRKAWRNGEFSLAEAAEQCGMAKTTFYNAARRAERAARAAEAKREEGPLRAQEGQAASPAKRKCRSLASARAN